jgi:hypothetical protein
MPKMQGGKFSPQQPRRLGERLPHGVPPKAGVRSVQEASLNLADKLEKVGAKLKTPMPVPPRPELLLLPNIPQPLHNVNPRTVLGSKWWDETRQAAYKSTEYHCLACGVSKYLAQSKQWLEAHEVYAIDYQKGQIRLIEVAPLCHFCHAFIHDGRLQAMLDKGLLSHAKFAAIVQHGERVLAAAGLKKPSRVEREQAFYGLELEGRVAPWEKWRLCIGRKRFPPKYKSVEEWRAHFDQVTEADEDA